MLVSQYECFCKSVTKKQLDKLVQMCVYLWHLKMDSHDAETVLRWLLGHKLPSMQKGWCWPMIKAPLQHVLCVKGKKHAPSVQIKTLFKIDLRDSLSFCQIIIMSHKQYKKNNSYKSFILFVICIAYKVYSQNISCF